MGTFVKSQEWPDLFYGLWTYTADKKQILAAGERPNFGSRVDNSLGQHLTDARQTCQLGPRYGVDFDSEHVGASGRRVAPVCQAAHEVLKTNGNRHHCPNCQK